ncbi:hypothetical protein PHLCEN_2v9068 [Hermanssonia centrifuga]|uniref:Major facilitator superfamily (MFS) profile domain-containing protein n=1 Tax=Hermanssonia centrifuga TaxID=98765 RepID=A0A2R6NRW1_9APHY|nr:hypothetical protein PHLCEN_2v9068 [Hermanssonia centrifuga]
MVHSPGPSKTRKHCLLVIFCFVQFLDAFNFSALFSALPRIQEDLKMSDGETTWIISAFQLTFASFLLLSGRLSDLYNPKYTFVIATLGIGVLSVITGFLQSKIPFIICRALAGISEHLYLCINLLSKALITFVLIVGAMTIPSALTLLVKLFPEPYEQSQAIGTFGGSGGIGNVLGLMIGAIFVKCASWRWIFWFLAILSIPIALISAFLLPRQKSSAEDDRDRVSSPLNKLNRLDLAGILLLTRE